MAGKRYRFDIVYAIIEVKTTLNAEQAQLAIENIASVRSLEIIPEQFSIGSSSSQGFSVSLCEPTPPIGMVFAYNSTVESFEAFKKWFTPDETNKFTKYPSLIGCLDQGLVSNDVVSGQPNKGSAIVFHYGDGKSAIVKQDVPTKEFMHEGVIYPIKTVQGQRKLIDQSRVLLLFVVVYITLNDSPEFLPLLYVSGPY